MPLALLLLPVIACLSMWLTIRIFIRLLYGPVKFAGFTIPGILPKYQPLIARRLSSQVIMHLSANREITAFITGSETLDKIMPSIEMHLDHFLKVKLKEALPVISVFVGEKVINQLKGLFLAELKLLFPDVMSQLFDGLQHNQKLAEAIYVRLSSIDIQKHGKDLIGSYRKKIIKLECLFAGIGFATGLLQVLVILFLY